MSMLLVNCITALALFAVFRQSDADIISDITTSESDEFSALQVKVEKFWKPIMRAAEDVKVDKHAQLYSDADAVIQELPAENIYVKEALIEAVQRLKNADGLLLRQSLQAADVASEKLATPSDFSLSSAFSFMTSGNYKSWVKGAMKRFTDGGQYGSKNQEQADRRQAAVTPLLRGAGANTGNILSDCRLSSKRSFDVLKYDIYEKGVPTTPQRAKDLADRIIEASGETRSKFTRGIRDMVKGITADVTEKQEDASVTLTRASVAASVAKAEAAMSSGSSASSPVSIGGSSYGISIGGSSSSILVGDSESGISIGGSVLLGGSSSGGSRPSEKLLSGSLPMSAISVGSAATSQIINL